MYNIEYIGCEQQRSGLSMHPTCGGQSLARFMTLNTAIRLLLSNIHPQAESKVFFTRTDLENVDDINNPKFVHIIVIFKAFSDINCLLFYVSLNFHLWQES